MKKILLWVMITACLIAGGCGGKASGATADYIGIDAAKETALRQAGVSPEQADFQTAGLDSRDGTFFYQVVFTQGGTEYRYDIDALTGVVIQESRSLETSEADGEEKERLDGLAEDVGTGTRPADGPDNGKPDGEPESQGLAAAGGQADSDASGREALDLQAGGAVGGDGALAAALAHAGLTEADISYSKTEADVDHGEKVFDVEFILPDGTEYDYKIRAADGKVLSFDFDAEGSFSGGNGGEGTISESQAKQVVMSRIPGVRQEDVVIWLEEDDNRLEYEGRVFYDDTEYEFKIDAYSGRVMEWEAEFGR